MFKVLNDIQLTRHFKLSEFECHDGQHEVILDGELVERLEALRVMLGVPVTVAAGYRNPVHNANVGGSPNSRHMKGEAADIKVNGVSPLMVARIAEKVGFRGIGVYRHNRQMFTHVDVRPVKSYWCDLMGTHDLKSVKSLEEIK